MADQIENNKAIYANTPAWHKKGTVITDRDMTPEEMWNVAFPHTYFKLNLQAMIDTAEGVVTTPLKRSVVIMRDDGLELNCVTPGFELVQPRDVVNQFLPLLNSGLVTLEAGMTLDGGSKIVALAKIKNAAAEVLPDDLIKSYFLIYTGFDGRMHLGMSQTNVRVVCANTLAAAQAGGIDYKFKHTRNIHNRMSDVMTTVKDSIEAFNASVEAYGVLARKQMTYTKQVEYIKNVMLTDKDKKAVADGEDLSTKKENIVKTVIELIDTQRGLEYVPAARGTAWQAYNAVTEYITHNHGRSDDSRLVNQWFGENVNLNQKALELALTY